MTSVVLDSSAVLAMVFGEPGGSDVRAAILSPNIEVSISAVNWCEVLTKLGQKTPIMTAGKLTAILPGVQVVPLGQTEAEQTASLGKACPSISLGDRAFLALANSLNAAAWTTDRMCAQLPGVAKVNMIR